MSTRGHHGLLLGAGVSGAAHKYWRIVFTGSRNYMGASGYVSLAEVEMRATVGGADQCSGGSSSADSFYASGYEASKAFDNNNASVWASNGGAFPHWIKYTFAAPVSVAEFAIRAADASYDPGRYEIPDSFYLQWSDDNSAWTTAKTLTGQSSSWSNGQLKAFSVP